MIDSPRPAPASRRARITGTFVDFSERTHDDNNLLDWTQDDWTQELSDMKAAGIELVIPARTMRYGRTYYFSDVFETFNEHDYLTPFMRAAADVGMAVYLSGLISDHFFRADDESFVRMMKRDVGIYDTILGELLDRYGHLPGIVGIYISHEADNENLASRARMRAAKEFFGELYARLRRKTSLPILSSPFFTKRMAPQELASFWTELLDRPMFDCIAMQDGVGCDRDIAPEDLPGYFSELAAVFEKNGIRFWHNCETFSFNPGYRGSGFDRKKIWLHPAPMDRIERQYELGRHYVSRTITWEYGHFLGRKQVGPDWYDAFARWNTGEAVPESSSSLSHA